MLPSYIIYRRKLGMSVVKKVPLVIRCDYFQSIYNDDFIKTAKATLKHIDFDTMVGIGFSGVLAVAKLSAPLGKHGLYLRKSAESCHAYTHEEGTIGDKWIMVDDQISSGSTFKVVYERVKALLTLRDHKSKFVGVYLYEQDEFRSIKGLQEVFERKNIEK